MVRLRGVLILLACWLAVSPAAARQVALVIGNDAYRNLEPLQKSAADAASYARVLASKGFDVTLRQNLTRDGMDEAVAAFTDAIAPGDTAVFVYSGHGWSDGVQNYLLGTDVPTGKNREVLARLSIPLKNGSNGVIDAMDQRGAALKVAIIDACRDSPFPPQAGGRGANRMAAGLVRVDPPRGTFVAFSAGAGQVALDRLSAADPDPNGVFTRVFLPLLDRDMTLLDAVKAAQADVAKLARSVGREQSPAYYDEVLGSACLGSACAPVAVPAQDERIWSLLKGSTDVASLTAFRDSLPAAAPVRSEVEARIGELRRVAALPVVPKAVLAPARPLDDATAAAIATCDRLAAFAYDPMRPAGVKGVMNLRPDLRPQAEAACRVAVTARPDDARYKLQLALSVVGGSAEAKAEGVRLLREAAAGGSLMAQTMLGVDLALGDAASNPEGVRLVLDAAERNLPFAQFIAANGYASGYGVKADPAQALAWLRRGVDAGFPPAMTAMGQMHVEAVGPFAPLLAANRLAPDRAEGLRLLTAAAQAGDAEAFRTLAKLRREGQKVPRDVGEAVRDLERAADLGDIASADELAAMYREGNDVAADPAKARRWLRRAADLGSSLAATALAAIYGEGKDVAADPAEAATWLRRAGDLGDVASMTTLAAMYLDGTNVAADPDEAIRWLRKAAGSCCGQGRDAMKTLASLYREGRGVTKDPAEALRWLLKATEGITSDSETDKLLAAMYRDGEGTPADDREAFRWFLKAAESGDAPSMETVAALYEGGKGVEFDIALAEAWYKKAAEAGQVGPMKHLGDLYAAGKLVRLDLAQARYWYGRAAESGDAAARAALDRLQRPAKKNTRPTQ